MHTMTVLSVKTVDYKRVYINEYSSCYMYATVLTFQFRNENQRAFSAMQNCLEEVAPVKGAHKAEGLGAPRRSGWVIGQVDRA